MEELKLSLLLNKKLLKRQSFYLRTPKGSSPLAPTIKKIHDKT